MTAFADACHHPFANGTESDAWQAAWCDLCARDHGIHEANLDGPLDSCPLMLEAFFGEWPEGWVPEPDDGHHSLPSAMVCMAFTPCDECGGDRWPEMRATRITDVVAYWAGRRE